MNKPFNPYAEWLDLPPDLRSPNHYQLLQIAPDEDDTQAINAAADRATVKVRGQRPGKQGAEWAKLLDELSQAKKCLTDPAHRAAYDRALGQEPGAAGAETESEPVVATVNQSADLYPPGMAPLAGTSAQTTSGAKGRSPMDPVSIAGKGKGKRRSGRDRASNGAVDPMAPVSTPDSKRAQRGKERPESAPTNPDAYPPNGEVPGAAVAREQVSRRKAAPAEIGRAGASIISDVPASKPLNAHVSPPRRQESSTLPIVLGVAAALVILTLALLFLATQRGAPKSSSVDPPAVAQRPGSGSPPTTQRPSAKPDSNTTEGKQTVTRPSSPSVSPPLTPEPDLGTPNGPAPNEPDQETRPVTSSPPGQDTPNGSSDSPANDTESPATPDSPPVNSENIDDPFMNDPEEGSTPGTDDASNPKMTPPTAAELTELSEALRTARAAVGELEFRIARLQLSKAGTIARLPEHKELVARLDRLTGLSEQFWTTLRQAMGELRGAEELPIGDSGLIVIVVEAKPDAITIRRNGRNETYPLSDLPPGLALAIADRTLDASSSDTPLIKGACLGAMKNPKQMHIDEAKRYWELARTQGADVDDLLKTLTDSYELK